MNNSYYRQKNQALLTACLNHTEDQTSEVQVLELLHAALSKSVKGQSTRPSPPLYTWLAAEDLGGDQAWIPLLAVASACFYAAADLYDDIQDRDHQQPVIAASSPAQAINIANLLLMASQRALTALPLPPETRLQLLDLFTTTGQTMSLGQFFDIHSTNLNTLDIPPEQIIPRKAGAEFACFVAAAPLALGLHTTGEHLSAYERLGQEFGSLLQIFTDYFDIWVPQSQASISQDLAIHKNSFPLYWARSDPFWGETVAIWLAGRASDSRRQFQLRRLLAQTQSLEKFSDYLASARTRVEKLLTELSLPSLQALWNEECSLAEQLLDSLQELRRKTSRSPQELIRPLPIDQALAAGLEYLNFIPEFRDVWEVQRWGFLDEPCLLGNLFNPLLLLETLLDLGQPIVEPLRRLLALRQPDGWHYYSNSLRIPPDSDDLGQILQLIGRCGIDAAAELAGPLQVLADNLEPSGFCPTWLCDEARFKRAEVDRIWFGKACLGVMANLYYGLAHYDAVRYDEQIRQGVSYLLSRFDPERELWPGIYYPSELYVSYLVARLLGQMGIEHPSLATAQARILSQQTLDGGWCGQPQSTASALLFLCAQPDPLRSQSQPARQRALAYLLDAQDYDGSWPAEPFFIRPGRDGAFETYAHPKLSTAFVLRALSRQQEVESL